MLKIDLSQLTISFLRGYEEAEKKYLDIILNFRGRIWANPFYCENFSLFWWYISHGGYIEIEPICAYFENECLTMNCETCVNNDGWFK